MAIWIQSLSWTLIYALGQGFIVYASLWLVLKLIPGLTANVKYHLSLSALTLLLGWFVTTWWQQFHMLANEQAITGNAYDMLSLKQQLTNTVVIDNYTGYRSLLLIIFPWLPVLYFTGLAFMLVRLSAGIIQLSSLKRTALASAGAMHNDLLTSLKNRLHVEVAVQLFISAKAQVPMVIGVLKPVILMPAAAMAQLSTEQLETILLHELAHIKRHDYLINILQTIVETVLFFNPFVWMISSITRREREHCCDDLVIAHTGEPLYYATALAALAENPATTPTLTVAASGQSNHLFNRIKRIMEMKKNSFSYSRMLAAILMIVAISCSVAWLTPSFAESKEGKRTETTTTTTIATYGNAIDTLRVNRLETNALAQRLMDDNLVNQIKGFVVEKKGNLLVINGKQQPDDIANKYLSDIKQKDIRIQVFSFQQRMQMHPDLSIIQILTPTTFSSPCVDYSTKPKKDGC